MNSTLQLLNLLNTFSMFGGEIHYKKNNEFKIKFINAFGEEDKLVLQLQSSSFEMFLQTIVESIQKRILIQIEEKEEQNSQTKEKQGFQIEE